MRSDPEDDLNGDVNRYQVAGSRRGKPKGSTLTEGLRQRKKKH